MLDEETLVPPEKLLDWQFILFIILALVGLSAVVKGLYELTVFSNQSYFSEENTLAATKSASLSLSQGFIYVDLAGAINKPGIYQLAVGSRLAEVVSQAGGFTPQVDLNYIAQELNLAHKLQDGDKIYIFSQEEKEYQQAAVEFCQSLGGNSPDISAGTETQISINNATTGELQTLEGIGEKRAEEILAGRPYQSLGELVQREILSASLFGKVQPRLKL